MSKILSAPRDEFTIPAFAVLPIRLEVLPQKVNPDYRKQITVLNLINRDDDATFEVHANNIDQVWPEHKRPHCMSSSGIRGRHGAPAHTWR